MGGKRKRKRERIFYLLIYSQSGYNSQDRALSRSPSHHPRCISRELDQTWSSLGSTSTHIGHRYCRWQLIYVLNTNSNVTFVENSALSLIMK